MGRLDNRPENHLLSHMALALDGDSHACFDLGVAYSTGASGLEVDLVQAHKWFNIAAMSGSREGQHCRAEISQEMTRTDIAEAQIVSGGFDSVDYLALTDLNSLARLTSFDGPARLLAAARMGNTRLLDNLQVG